MRSSREAGFAPHRQDGAELLQRFASSPDGLAEAEALLRLRLDGPNQLSETKRPPLIKRFLVHLGHRFALLLWAGAALSALAEYFSPGQGMALIAVALVAVVVINAAFGFWQQTRVEHAMAAFRGLLSRRARVLRAGIERDVDAAEIVTGDLIVLREGDRVPADARLLTASALKVDNSPLTGECEPQLRTTLPAHGALIESRNLVFAGTLVTTGTGRAVVYATGDDTEIGHIAGITRQTPQRMTPITLELSHFVRVISLIALALGAVFFVASWAMGNPFWTNLVFAIGIIVANVPEGLLPTVTLGLAISGRKMARRNALLKTLESAETLGCTTVICTDKTGTLTQNDMRVTDVLLGTPQSGAVSSDAALTIMALCNNAAFDPARTPPTSGDPTETALLAHVEERRPGLLARLRVERPRVYERPFDSATREMATIHEGREGLEALLKGAPEVVLEQCTSLYAGDGSALAQERKRELLREAEALARRGRRVLALARKRVPREGGLESAATGSGYEFVALIAMRDAPRPEVADAVARCRAAGIRVVVVSGDHPLTVAAIAAEVGIGAAGTAVRTGADLAGWSDAALRQALSSGELLFARTSPLDKLRIVRALQELGEIVAVTGDGVNDAPALKRADIGVAMGQSGTDVAREAADMVLMDDDFATIVAAVEEGRVVYANIRRFVGYVLTSNVPEILPYIAFVLLGIPLPLPILLVLAIDLGTDMAPAIALGTESAENDVMRLPPRSRTERLLSPELLLTSYVLFGLLEAAAGFAAYLAVLRAGGFDFGADLVPDPLLYARATAAYFAAVVCCQVANVFVWRTARESILVKGLFANRAVLVGVIAELVLLVVIVETELGQRVFGTESLPLTAWLVPLPFAVGMLLLAETMKFAVRARNGVTSVTAQLHERGQ